MSAAALNDAGVVIKDVVIDDVAIEDVARGVHRRDTQRMSRLRVDRLWLAFLIALVPLVILLVVQYAWLQRLERVTTLAYRASVHSVLSLVTADIENFYRELGEEQLWRVEPVFQDSTFTSLASFWRDHPNPAVRRHFLVDYREKTFGDFYFYDREKDRLIEMFSSEESFAVIVACSPFARTGSATQRWRTSRITADDRNPSHRILLRPILDESESTIGIVGMILDEEYFHDEVLPQTVNSSLAEFSTDSDGFALRIRNADGRVVYGSPGTGEFTSIRSAQLDFVFTDWSADLYHYGTTPEGAFKANLRIPMILSGLLAVAILVGLVLSLRAARHALRLSTMKSDFVSNVSHELRTPVASIRVLADLLRSGKVASPDKVSEYGGLIEAESRKLTHLVDKVLEFSRIESGQQQYEFRELEPKSFLSQIVESFRTRPISSGFEVRLSMPDRKCAPVRGDGTALTQAIGNLLENAVKYSGTSRLVEVELADEEAGIRISVQDHGIGIEPGEHTRVFDRFHRAARADVHDVKGSGLGLAIVQEIVSAHQGTIDLVSEPGKGSTFHLWLPRRAETQPRPAGSVEGSEPSGVATA